MQLLNTSRRLIVLNYRTSKNEKRSVELPPASAPVPVASATASLIAATAFFKAMTESGDIRVLPTSKPSKDADEG